MLGQGVEADLAQALTCYEKSAGRGDESALCALGRFYEEGIQVETDIQRALDYYRQAVEGADSEAMYRLARLYAKGRGVLRDREEAIRLCQLALGADDFNRSEETERLVRELLAWLG